MQKNVASTVVYAASALVLGIIALVAGLVWRNETNSSETVTAVSPSILPAILAFLGIILIIYGLLLFLVLWLRRKSAPENMGVPKAIQTDSTDDSLLPANGTEAISRNPNR